MSQLTGLFLQNEKHYIGFCLEVPGANGQGRTLASCRKSLCQSIKLMIEENAVELIEFLPGEIKIEKLDIDEKAITRAIDYGKRMHSASRGQGVSG